MHGHVQRIRTHVWRIRMRWRSARNHNKMGMVSVARHNNKMGMVVSAARNHNKMGIMVVSVARYHNKI